MDIFTNPPKAYCTAGGLLTLKQVGEDNAKGNAGKYFWTCGCTPGYFKWAASFTPQTGVEYPCKSLAPQPGAYNAGSNGSSNASDQRGVKRSAELSVDELDALVNNLLDANSKFEAFVHTVVGRYIEENKENLFGCVGAVDDTPDERLAKHLTTAVLPLKVLPVNTKRFKK
jgi:hypothetical protein